MQEVCSSADAGIRTSGGHGPFFTEVTVYNYKDGSETKVRDELNAWAVSATDAKEVSQENHGGECRGGMRAPWGRTVWVQKVRITKEDGGLFDRYTSGVTADGKAVEGTVLCERTYSNIMPCQN